MKKRYGFMAILLVAACLWGLVLPTLGAGPQKLASGTCGDSLTWVLTDDGVLTISGTGDMENYSYEGVTPWWPHRDQIQKVILEYGVTSISASAFVDFSHITEVTIANSVKTIGQEAFSGCSSIKQITIPDSVTTLGTKAFYQCTDLRSAVLGEGLEVLAGSTFEKCSKLMNVVFPDSLRKIGGCAFYQCPKFEIIVLPAGVEVIGTNAFHSVWHVLFKGTEEQWNAIDNSPLGNTLLKKTVHFDCTGEELTYTVEKETSCTKQGVIGIDCAVCGKHRELLPEPTGHQWDEGVVTREPTITAAGEKTYTCEKCGDTKLEAIPQLPNDAGETKVANGVCGDNLRWVLTESGKLTVSGTGQMYNYGSYDQPWYSVRDSIRSVVVEEGVTNIGSNAFEFCKSLETVVVEDGLTSIGAGAFFGCQKLERVELPNSVTVIGISAFRDCASLRSIRLPDGLKRIADHTFEGCKSLRVVVIPKKVYEIAGGAFSECKELWHILFKGTKSQWKQVTVATHRGDSSSRVKDAVIHYKCTGDEVTDVENKACSICDPCAHKWDDGKIVKAATCAEDGEKLLTCTKCEETKTEAILRTDTHSFGDWAKADASFHGRSCSVCGLEESESHYWDAGRVTKDAACTEAGEMTYTCTVCAAALTEAIPATGHSYGDWTQVKAPTTEETGLEEQTCGSCGDRQQRELAKLEPVPTEPTAPAEPTQPQTQPTEPIEKQPDDPSTVLIVVIGAVGVLAIGGTAWMTVLKKKRN